MEKKLPKSWINTTLGEVVRQIIGGGTPSKNDAANFSGSIPFMTVKDMNVSRPIDTMDHITKKALQGSSAKLIPADTIVIATRMGLGKVVRPVVDVAINQDLKAIFPSAAIAKDYLEQWFVSRANYLESQGTGTTVKGLRLELIRGLSLPLAPLNEQRRIVDRIEQLSGDLDAGEALLNKVQMQLATYRQSVLKAAVTGELTKNWRKKNNQNLETGDTLLSRINKECKSRIKNWKPVKGDQNDSSLFPQVPDEWAIERLGNLNINIFDGPFGSNLKTKDYTSSGVRVIRLQNIERGYFVDEKQSFISKKKYETIKKHTVVPKDIVFSSFVTDAIRSTLVPEHISFAVNKADCFGIRFFGEAVNPKFVQFFLQSQNAFNQVEGMIHGVGRPRINTTQLKDVMIPICCLEEQEEIISRVEAVFSQIAALENWCVTSLKRSATLRQSILKSAFSGNLVAQDPADEPASKLIERIQQDNSVKITKKTASPKEKRHRGRKAKSRAA